MSDAQSIKLPTLSVVVPVHNEVDALPDFHRELTRVVGNMAVVPEYIYVDDGSTDDSWQLIKTFGGDVRRIRFSRNFGKEAALSAGLDVASGDAIVVIDADLQHPPEVIVELYARWLAGYKIVCAARANRDTDGPLRRFASRSFYRTFNSLSDQPIPRGVSDFRLMDRRVVDIVRLMPEKSRFMKAILSWPGFDMDIVPFEVAPRAGGTSKFSPFRLWRFGLDGLFNFSSKPLQVWMYLGLTTIALSIVIFIVIVIGYIVSGASVSGYRTVIALLIGVSGVQILGIGMLGEYLARVFIEVKRRPLYVVSESNVAPGSDNDWAHIRGELATFPPV